MPRGEGLPPIFLDYEVAGPTTRSVDDAIAVMELIGEDMRGIAAQPERPARILYIPRFADHPVDPQIAALTEAASRQLAALGHEVETAGRLDIFEAVNSRWPLLSQVGLAWRVEDPDPLVETFIGIVRGRTARSSRGDSPRDPSPPRTRRPDAATRRTGRRRPRR